MPALDRTPEFKQAVQKAEAALPASAKRQRVKFGAHRTGPDPQHDPWIHQAHQLATTLRSYLTFLASIRRAYLDLSSSSSTSACHPARPPPPRQLDPAQGLAAWEGVRWLSDRERDQIDFAVAAALRKAVDRVRQLEALENARLAVAKRDNPNAGLSRLLGLVSSAADTAARSPEAQAQAEHRALVTLYLNQLLAEVSQRQRDQQETRVRRQLERTQTLGGMAAAGSRGGIRGADERAQQGGPLVGEVPAMYRPAPAAPIPGPPGLGGLGPSGTEYDHLEDDQDDDGHPLGSELTAEQVQQFEAEESALLQATRSDLDALRTAESSLLEISSLQTQLAHHLGQQSELTDKLWEEAVTVSGEVGRGNEQLRKAKERSRDSRRWLLVFLLGSSFTLLFLDYYA